MVLGNQINLNNLTDFLHMYSFWSWDYLSYCWRNKVLDRIPDHLNLRHNFRVHLAIIICRFF